MVCVECVRLVWMVSCVSGTRTRGCDSYVFNWMSRTDLYQALFTIVTPFSVVRRLLTLFSFIFVTHADGCCGVSSSSSS